MSIIVLGIDLAKSAFTVHGWVNQASPSWCVLGWGESNCFRS
jgi:hypothetical protein